VERELVSFLTAGLARPAPQPPGPGPAGLAGLDGFYRDVTPGEELSAPWARLGGVEVVRHGEGLAVREVRVTGPRSLFTRSDVEPLVPAGVDAFRRPAEVLSSLTFLRGPDGRAQAVVTPGALLERAPGGLLALERALLGAALVLSVAGAALAPAVLLLSSRAGGWGWGLAALASLPGACLAALWVVFHRWPDRLGAFGAVSAAVTILGWAFAASALALLAAAALAPREVGLTARAHALLVGAAGMGLALFAAQAGWIGLRTWRW
jgi:hypothetical protein